MLLAVPPLANSGRYAVEHSLAASVAKRVSLLPISLPFQNDNLLFAGYIYIFYISPYQHKNEIGLPVSIPGGLVVFSSLA